MRIDVKKFLFGGSTSQKDAFYREAQNLGAIHFINMQGNLSKELPHEVQNISKAIKIILTLPPLPEEELEHFDLALGLANRIIQVKHDLDKDQELLRMLALEIERVRIYGDFSKEDIDLIQKEGDLIIQFFYAKEGFSENLKEDDGLIFIGSDHALDYFISINKERKAYERMVEMKIDEPIGVLLEKEQHLKEKIEATEKRLNTYARYNHFLHHALLHHLNDYHLQSANLSSQLEMDGELFFAEGFVPLDRIEEMQKLTSSLNIYAEEIQIDENEQIPTYLKNEGTHKIGEDLVDIYDTPSHTDDDPSLWVLFSFALFFSMIIGDAGYGLVFLAAGLYIRYKTGILKGMKGRMWNLWVMLSVACIIWGTMAHSFFGIEMSVNSRFHKISLLNYVAEKKAEYYLQHKGETYDTWVKEYPKIAEAKSGADVLKEGMKIVNGEEKYEIVGKLNDGIMLEIALLVGIIHITIAFLRYIKRNLAGIGWILFMWGCYFYFPSYLKTISMTNYLFGISVEEAARGGLILIYSGLLIAFIFSIIKHKIFGILEMMQVIQVFGDILSYLRIYALGLAGAIVMATINEFAWSMNFILGPILFVVGHITNMMLGIMGGVIHGLRLNFIEWYHYSFEGGGKKFNPLRKESIE